MLMPVKPIFVKRPIEFRSVRHDFSSGVSVKFFNCLDVIHENYVNQQDRAFMPEFSHLNFMVRDNTKIVGYIVSGHYFDYRKVYL